ncbi:MAG: hypothetical protein PVH37_30020 [Desulfobacterales bacterium]|jgi:hypothetical protein
MKAGEDAGIRCFFVCSSILLGYRGCRLMVETRTRADPVFVCGRIRVETENASRESSSTISRTLN